MFISWGGRTCRRLCLEAALASKEGVGRSRLGENESQASELLVVRDSKALLSIRVRPCKIARASRGV